MTSALESAADHAIDAALDLLARSDVGSGPRIRKTDRDFATAADFAIEDSTRALLARLTPDLGFLGEERGHTGSRERYWCLDPIDGTTNFSRSLPHWGIALALVADGEPQSGRVVLPALTEQYRTRDGSAYLDGTRITVTPTHTLADAIVSVGDFATGSGSKEANAARLAIIGRLADRVGRIRMLGSAATDLAWLAAGRLDAVVIASNHPWDVAAGIAIARAAGAVVTHFDGQPYRLDGPDVLAAAPGVHGDLVRLSLGDAGTGAGLHGS